MVPDIVRRLALAALVTLGTASVLIPEASAGPRGAFVVGPAPAPVDFHGRGHHRWKSAPDLRRHERGCSPRRALHKAGRIGLRHARIVRATPRGIAVAGRFDRDRAVVDIGNRPNCPVRNIRTR